MVFSFKPKTERDSIMKSGARTAGIMLGLLIGCGFLYLSIRSLNWPTVTRTLSSVEPVWAFLCLPALAMAYYIRLDRWRRMLAALGSNATHADLAAPFLGSFALNNVLPLRLGDAVRAAGYRKQLGVSASGGLASLLVERIYDLYALLLIGLVALTSLDFTNLQFDLSILKSGVWGLGLVVVALSCILLIPKQFVRLALLLRSTLLGKVLPSSLWRFGINTMLRVSQIARKSNSVFLMLSSVIAWSLEGFVIFSSAKALTVATQFTGSWLALVTANLGTLIPGTPGHFGTFHFIGGQTLAFTGAEFSETMPVITLAHFITWSGVTVAGFLALAIQRRNGMHLASRKARKTTKI